MRRYFTLINLLILCGTLAVNAHSRKLHHAHKIHHFTRLDLPVAVPTAINAGHVSADSLLAFAQTLLGVPYRPASSDPSSGFDCSGFVSYVFKKFNFNVPRSSCEFINAGEKINIEDAMPGDIILFTGTKSHHPHSIGHIGIVFSNNDGGLKFIHSTSGKEYCVTVSDMDDTYKRRFVQVVRLLKQDNNL
jgi:lipoprotein Spr